MQPQEHHAAAHGPAASRRPRDSKTMRILSVVLLVSVALILAATAFYLSRGGTGGEEKFIKKDKFQAVFLNNGQVYFGKVRDLNSRFVTIDNIYYLRVSQQVQPNQTNSSQQQQAQQDVSLAKLGCELHGPDDKMVINRDQVTFWENLKDDGQVVKAITEYVKQNPNGVQCNTSTSNSTNTNTNTNTNAKP